MEPKNYSTIRSILKKEQGEKIAPYVFKLSDTKTIEEYLDKERITYEIYLEEPTGVAKKRVSSEAYRKHMKKRKIVEE
jgi:hypothetical protein